MLLIGILYGVWYSGSFFGDGIDCSDCNNRLSDGSSRTSESNNVALFYPFPFCFCNYKEIDTLPKDSGCWCSSLYWSESEITSDEHHLVVDVVWLRFIPFFVLHGKHPFDSFDTVPKNLM